MATIVLKQVGQNLILTIDGKEYTKRVAEKEERETLKSVIKDTQASPTKANVKALIGMFTEKTVAKEKETERAKVAEKAVDKQVKKESKKVQKKEAVIEDTPITQLVSVKELQAKIAELESENNTLKMKAAQRPEPVKSTPSRREY